MEFPFIKSKIKQEKTPHGNIMQIEVVEEREIKGHYFEFVLKLYKFFLETFMFEKNGKWGSVMVIPRS